MRAQAASLRAVAAALAVAVGITMLGCTQPPFTSDQGVSACHFLVCDDEGLQDAVLADRVRQVLQVVFIHELARLARVGDDHRDRRVSIR